MAQEISNQLAHDLYQRMLRIRVFETTARDLFTAAQIPGFIHVSIGEEAVAVGVLAALGPQDRFTSSHRCHAHIIARQADLGRLMAEIMGRATGFCGGRGGELHVYDAASGCLGSNGIVGGGLPIATGSALAADVLGQNSVTVCFFGDGASNQGTFHESLNLASVWQLPVVFVCENNGYGQWSSSKVMVSVPDIATRAASYSMPGHVVDGNNVLEVFEYTTRAVEHARSGHGPTLLECKTARWEGHVVGEDALLTTPYRTKEEIAEVKRQCPISRFEKWALDAKKLDPSDIKKIGDQVARDVAAAVEFAKASPMPDAATVTDRVFA